MKKIAVVMLMLFPILVQGQTSKFGNWLVYIGNNKISPKVTIWNEVQYRNFNFIGDLEQLLLRGGVGYDISEKNNTILLGYAFIHSEPYRADGTRNVTDEHRIFQQFITKHSFWRINIQHRYRFEQRFIGNQFKMRIRYLFGLTLPLNKEKIEKNTLYLALTNEIFINTTGPLFDRDRYFAGLGFAISPEVRIETGIMVQQYDFTNRAQWQIAFINNLPYFKAKEALPKE